MEKQFTLISIDSKTVTCDLGDGAMPAESSFYAKGYGDFIAIEHHTSKNFGIVQVLVSAVTVNGATFDNDVDAVTAINALDVWVRPGTGPDDSGDVDIDAIHVNFTEAALNDPDGEPNSGDETLPLPTTGDTIPTVFGKILAWLKRLGKFAFATAIDWYEDIINKPNFAEVATSGKYTDLSERPTLPPVLTDAEYSADGTTITATYIQFDPIAGTQTTFTHLFPVVSEVDAGAMTAEAYNLLLSLNNQFEAFAKQGGKLINVIFPTQAAIAAYAIPDTVNYGDWALVQDDETQDGHRTRYVCSDVEGVKTFVFAYVDESDPIGIATLEAVGIVKSSSTTGKILVEADGTMSVVGWDDLTQRVADKQDKLSGVTDIQVAAAAPETDDTVLRLILE